MSEIQQNRYDQLIRRVTGAIGPGSKVNEAITELFPMIDVERVPGELLALMGTRICYGGAVQAGVAAEFSKIQILNPVGSGILITVTSCIVTLDTSANINWDIIGIALPSAVGNERVRDTRVGTDDIPTGEIRIDTQVGATTSTGNSRLLANSPLTLKDENGFAVLTAGAAFEVGVVAANTAIRATFYWRERVAEQSELNF